MQFSNSSMTLTPGARPTINKLVFDSNPSTETNGKNVK